jgi:hypothetical protein
MTTILREEDTMKTRIAALLAIPVLALGCAATATRPAAASATKADTATTKADTARTTTDTTKTKTTTDTTKTKPDTAKVVGTWALELMFEGQMQKITLEIKTKDDGSLTGTWIGPHRTNELVDFTWDGTTLTFTRNVEREGKPVALKHKATVSGDTMKGEITQPPPQEVVPFTATRKKAQ